MEDPEAEWETDEEGYHDDGWNSSGGKVGWVLDKGLRLGKGILFTGFVITSAPIVLPPLVVISAIGFVCSVPSGFFLASYACTEKLMSKLLPCPSDATTSTTHSELFLGYGGGDDDGGNIYKQSGLDLGKKRLFGGLNFDVEESGFEEDAGEDVRRDGGESSQENDVVIGGVGEGEGKKVGTEVSGDLNFDVEESGFEEDVSEDVGREGVELSKENDVVIGGVGEGEGKKVGTEVSGGLNFDVEESGFEEDVSEDVGREGVEFSKENDVVIGGVGEGEGKKVGTKVSGVDVLGVVIIIEGDEKLGGNVKEEAVPFEVTGVAVDLCEGHVSNKEDKMVKETRELVKKMRDEGIDDIGAVEEKQFGPREGSEEIGGTANEMGMKKGDRNALGSVGAEPDVPIMEQKVEQNGKETRGSLEKKDVDVVSSEEKKSQGSKANKSEKGKTKGEEDVQPKEKEVALPSNAGASEVSDRSAIGLSDSRNSAGLQQSTKDSGGREGRVLPNYAVHKIADPLKITVSLGGHDLKLTEKSSGGPIGAASCKVLHSEEQMWKQIDAMRKILGYTAPRHTTCVEELKALYIFAGVELPTSFKDPSDLVEVNNKLRSLMSIVGVK